MSNHPGLADVATKEQDQRSFFLRMYGKLFVLTECVASTCPQRPGVAAFRTLTPGTFHAKQGGMLFTSDTSEVEI